MDSVLSVQNKNFSGDRKEFKNVFGAVRKANSLEFGKSCEDLSWNHRTSTPHRSETNGIAERAVRRIKEGTSAVLLQSGLDEKWLVDSMERHCYLRNIQDLLSDGKRPSERRFVVPFKGPAIPFGAMESGRETSWSQTTSTPHRSETHGIAERAARRVKEGTSAVLLQSGLGEKWWADSIDYYCYLRNVQDLLADGKGSCERRFGAMVEFRFQRETSQGFTNLARRFCQEYSSEMYEKRADIEERQYSDRGH